VDDDPALGDAAAVAPPVFEMYVAFSFFFKRSWLPSSSYAGGAASPSSDVVSGFDVRIALEDVEEVVEVEIEGGAAAAVAAPLFTGTEDDSDVEDVEKGLGRLVSA